jgi:ketosteroid isomerase-like protein
MLALSLLLATSPGAEAPPPLPSVALPPALDRVLRDYERAWQARDTTSLAALFADDGFVLQNGRPPVRGKGAIRAAYQGSGGVLALRALAYAIEGRVGYVIGAYATAAGGPDVGKFVLALKQGADGRWLIAADMDNGNQRPPPPAPPSPPVPPSPPSR